MLSSQNSKFNFQRILDSYFDYSIGFFFYNAMTKFDLYGLGKNDEYFVNFCNWARNIVDFELDELYQDETAILRSTNLGKERFEVLKNSIRKEVITTNNQMDGR